MSPSVSPGAAVVAPAGGLPARTLRALRRRVPATAPATIVMVVLFGGALVGALRQSVRGADGATTFDAWRAVLGDALFLRSFGFTSAITFAVLATSLPLAVFGARAVRRRAWLRTLSAVPVAIPHVVVASTFALWVGPGGIADRLLTDVVDLPVLVRDRVGLGIWLVNVVKEAPFLLLLFVAAWDDGADARLEVGRACGLGRWDRFRLIVWPTLRVPAAIGTVVIIGFTFGSFEVPLVVGPNDPPMVAVWALEETRLGGTLAQARGAAILLASAVATLVLLLAPARLARQART